MQPNLPLFFPHLQTAVLATHGPILFGEWKRSAQALEMDLVLFGEDSPGSWMNIQRGGWMATRCVHPLGPVDSSLCGEGHNCRKLEWGASKAEL